MISSAGAGVKSRRSACHAAYGPVRDPREPGIAVKHRRNGTVDGDRLDQICTPQMDPMFGRVTEHEHHFKIGGYFRGVR
jgi:hypothetical protein